MRVLFDHGTPAPLRQYLTGHSVTKARDEGWNELSNGDLLEAAEVAGFEVLVTTDKNIRYQQNLSRHKIAIVVLSNPQWPVARQYAARIVAAVDTAIPGSYSEVDTSPASKKF
jgi:hypothetical protein